MKEERDEKQVRRQRERERERKRERESTHLRGTDDIAGY